MKKIYAGVLLIFSAMTLSVHAQQDPQFSQNMFIKQSVNPGYTGSNGAYCGTLLYRNQWTGFGAEPKTMLFTGDAYIEDISCGAGLTVISDQLGYQKNLTLLGNFAYQADMGGGKLGIGASFGLMQKTLDGSKFVPNQYPDPVIPTSNVTGSTFDLGAGLYYAGNNGLYAGVAASHLTAGQIKYGDTKTLLARHYYLQAGYDVGLTSSLTLKPSVLVKTDAGSTQADINANLLINNKYWGGLSYRLQDAIVIMAGLEIIPNLKFGYSYDLTLSDLKSYSSGSHEVMLNYCFKIVKPKIRQFHRNVRFL